MAEDISRKTVLVLVVLTLVVSVLSLFAVIDTVSNREVYATQVQPVSNTATGKVYLSVEQPAKPVIVTGQVTLSVKN
jgi:hypothetical protein